MKKLLFSLALCFVSISVNGAQAPMSKAKLKAPLPSNLWIEMSKIIQPGVVGVYLDVDIKKTRMRRDPLFEFFEEFFGRGFEYNDPRKNKKASPIGTGFIIDKQGHIVTNYHVIETIDNQRLETKLQVQIFGESKLHDVDLIGRDPRGDIALLKLRKLPKRLSPLVFGDSKKLEVGEYVAAFGNPYGHSNSMTVGIVSAKGRTIRELNRFPFIQTDASINPGNSGGPLLNTDGYVIGVNTAIDARAQGIGFAIPADYVKKITAVMKSGGTIQRAYMGLSFASLHPQVAIAYGINKSGIVVAGVEPGYGAANAGLKQNDIIYEINNEPLLNSEDFVNRIQDSQVGAVLKVKALRPNDGKFLEMSFDVKLSEFPSKNQQWANQRKTRKKPGDYRGQTAPYDFGFTVVDSSSGARRHFDVPIRFPFGPIVSSVAVDSSAGKSGIKPGQIILRVNGKGVNKASDVIKALKATGNSIWVHTHKGEKKLNL